MIAAIKKNEVHLIGNNNKMRLVIYWFYVIYFIFLFVNNGVWTLGLALARQALYHLSHSTALQFSFFLKSEVKAPGGLHL
jgi:hypothetical protein